MDNNGVIKYKILVVVMLIVGIIALGFIFFTKSNKENISQEVGSRVVENTPKIVEEREEKTSMSLIMVGDYLIHSSVYKDAAKNAGGTGYDFKPMLKYIKEKVKDYDLAYYNQETILGGSEIGVSDYPNFNSPYEAGDAMIDAGFNLVSLATNHTMDSREKAVLNSRKYWDRQQNILAVRKL